MKLFTLWISLVFANFLYQAIKDNKWSSAIEWSYAQGVALLLAGIQSK